MGQICSYEKQIIVKDRPENIRKEDNLIDINNKVDFSDLLEDEMEEDFQKIQDILNNPDFKTKSNQLLKDQKLKSFSQKVNFWLELKPINNSDDYMHYHYTELEMPFTQDLYNMFQLNLNEEIFKKLDDSIDQFEIKNQSIDHEYAIQIIYTKTKKVLIVQPRYFLVLKVVKRNDQNDYQQYQKSVQFSKLSKNSSVDQYQEQFKHQLAKIHFSALDFQKKDGSLIMRQYNELDVLSSIGKRLVKGTIKSKTKNYHNKYLLELIEFLLRGYTDDLFWFSQDKEDIEQIFRDNMQILKNMNIDSKLLSEESQKKYNVLMKNKTNMILESELYDNTPQQQSKNDIDIDQSQLRKDLISDFQQSNQNQPSTDLDQMNQLLDKSKQDFQNQQNDQTQQVDQFNELLQNAQDNFKKNKDQQITEEINDQNIIENEVQQDIEQPLIQEKEQNLQEDDLKNEDITQTTDTINENNIIQQKQDIETKGLTEEEAMQKELFKMQDALVDTRINQQDSQDNSNINQNNEIEKNDDQMQIIQKIFIQYFLLNLRKFFHFCSSLK